MLGVGAICHELGGNEESVKALKAALGKKIKAIAIADDRLRIEFEDATKIMVWDKGQSCCESRYMRTDDDLPTFVGAALQGMSLEDAPTTHPDGDEHEVQFLRVATDKGTIVFSNHNEHNGYYGGFGIQIDQVTD